MGPSISKYNCTKLNSTEIKINPEPLKRKRRRRSSLRDMMNDLHSFLRSSDSSTRKKHLQNYFTVSSTNCSIELFHGEKGISSQRVPFAGVNDFEFSVLLGSGGFGAVFKARRRSTGFDYALKVQPIEALARSTRSMARRETDETLVHMERTVLATCREHPFIVNLEYAFYTEKHAILALEYVAGGTLSNLITSSPSRRLPFHLCKLYTMELVSALNHMHCKGIIYRDLKPSNILLTLSGHIKLADFGLSGSLVKREDNGTRLNSLCQAASCESIQADPELIVQMATARHDEPTASTGESTTTSTDDDNDDKSIEHHVQQQHQYERNVKWIRRKTVCGTAGYRPPEQVQERYMDYYSRVGYDERADWFSLGVCCYTMLTGRRPFPTKKELMQSDSQKKLNQEEYFKQKVIGEGLARKVLDDAEYQCLMFEVRYPSYFEDQVDAKNFISALLSRDPEYRPRYDGIINHAWMSDEDFECDKLMKCPIPDWVLEHVKLNSSKIDAIQEERLTSESNRRCSFSLSDCIDEMCNEYYEKNGVASAEAFELKWTSKAKSETLKLFRHWNYMSDNVVRLETNIACSESHSLSERLLKAMLPQMSSRKLCAATKL